MFKALKYLLISVILTAGITPLAQAQLDSEAVEIVNQSMEFLAKKKHSAAKWFVTYDSGDNDKNTVTTTWNGKSALSRKKGYYAISERHGERYEYFYDGEVFTAKNLDGLYYTQVPIEGSFDELVEFLSEENHLILPIWELLSEEHASDLGTGVTKAEYIGETKIMGLGAHHLKLSKPGREWEMWISNVPKRPVPLMIRGHTPENGGSHYQAMFYDWSFKPTAKRREFFFRPGAKDIKMDWETFKTRAIQGGELEFTE